MLQQAASVCDWSSLGGLFMATCQLEEEVCASLLPDFQAALRHPGLPLALVWHEFSSHITHKLSTLYSICLQ